MNLIHLDDPFPLILSAALSFIFLVAIWAGVSRRFWFVRASVAVGVLGALVAVRAYQPMVWSLLAMCGTAGLSRLTVPKKATEETNGDCELAAKIFRFRLVDALLATILLSIVFAMLAAAWRSGSALLWQQGAWMLSCFLLAELCLLVTVMKGWRRVLAGAVLAGGIALASSMGTAWIDKINGLNYVLGYSIRQTCPLIFGSFVFIVLLTLNLFKFSFASSSSPSLAVLRVRLLSRIALVIWLAALLIPGLMIFVNMVQGPSIPRTSYTNDMASKRLMENLEALAMLNPGEASIRSLKQSDPRAGQNAERLYSQIEQSLAEPRHITFEFDPDNRLGYISQWSDSIDCGRIVLRTLEAEATAAAAAGEFDNSADNSLVSMQMGNSFSRGGMTIQSLCGFACEGIGSRQLAQHLDDFSIARIRSLLDALQRIDASREPAEITLQRDLAFSDRAHNWMYRLEAAVARITTGDIQPRSGSFISAAQRRDATIQLLITELAIRIYKDEHGELPETLQQLTPGILDTVPLDPYSSRPLIYRRTETGSVLYSVGKDLQDNGGQFGTYQETHTKPGFDYDLKNIYY